jgi:hypothetical protein
VTIAGLAICLAFQFAACGSFAEVSRSTVQKVMVPKEIERIPSLYFEECAEPGALTDLYYHTYESFSYNEKSKPLQKRAVVYLPNGYSKDRQYDVFYLMHGGWGDETTDSWNTTETIPP